MLNGIDAMFIGYIAFIIAGIALLLSRYLPTKAFLLSLGGLGTWLVYGGVLGYAGVIGDASLRPPASRASLSPDTRVSLRGTVPGAIVGGRAAGA